MSISTDQNLPKGYTLHTGYPPISQYLHLRSIAGLSARTPSEAAAVSTGSWFGCYVTFDAPGEGSQAVGMGRVIGDGGWYFHIADMAVHPQHQRKGLGDVILKRPVDVEVPDQDLTIIPSSSGAASWNPFL